MTHSRRIDALAAALTSPANAGLDPAYESWLIGQYEGTEAPWTCPCCRHYRDVVLGNFTALISTDPDEWDHVRQTPKPPRPLHLVAHLAERSST